MKQITLFVLFQLAILATANLKRNLAKRQSDEVHLTALKEQIQGISFFYCYFWVGLKWQKKKKKRKIKGIFDPYRAAI